MAETNFPSVFDGPICFLDLLGPTRMETNRLTFFLYSPNVNFKLWHLIYYFHCYKIGLNFIYIFSFCLIPMPWSHPASIHSGLKRVHIFFFTICQRCHWKMPIVRTVSFVYSAIYFPIVPNVHNLNALQWIQTNKTPFGSRKKITEIRPEQFDYILDPSWSDSSSSFFLYPFPVCFCYCSFLNIIRFVYFLLPFPVFLFSCYYIDPSVWRLSSNVWTLNIIRSNWFILLYKSSEVRVFCLNSAWSIDLPFDFYRFMKDLSGSSLFNGNIELEKNGSKWNWLI